MTTQTTATQADIDARTHAAYVDNGENKAATARALGISASAVADRIKRHLARHEQDTLADSRALDAAQAEQDAEYAADSEAAERAPVELPDPVHGGDVFARIEASDPDMRAMAETDAALNGETGDVVSEYADRMRAETEAALARGEDTYTGTVCPDPSCGAVAYAFKAGHQTGCRYHKLNAGRIQVGEAVAQATAAATKAAQQHVAEVIANATEVPAEALAAIGDAVNLLNRPYLNAQQHGEAASEQPADGDSELHTHCTKCGWDFGHAIKQAVCGSPKMCARRVELGDPNFGRRTPKVSA